MRVVELEGLEKRSAEMASEAAGADGAPTVAGCPGSAQSLSRAPVAPLADLLAELERDRTER